jgi:MerR family redox-sensitive transcriptional activator SoxR
VGLLPLPRRINGRRRYDEDVFRLLGVIQAARGAGFGIRELRDLFAPADGVPVSARLRPMAARKIAELDALIARAEERKRLLAHAEECRCVNVADCAEITFDGRGFQLSASLRCSGPDAD